MAIIRTSRYHIEITNIDKNGNLNIVYPKNTVDDVYMDPKKSITIKGKVFFYGATADDANVQTINVSIPGFQLVEGAHVTILFEHGITSTNPKLKINNGIQTFTAVPIYYQGKPLPSNLIKERAIVDLVYSVGNFHVSHEFITPPLSLNNTRKFFLTGVDENNAKTYPDDNLYDNAVYVDSVEGRLCATSFLGTTVFFDTTSSYINKTDYTGNSATTTKFKTARNIKIGKKTNPFDGTSNIEFTLEQIDAVAKDGDTMRGDLKLTSAVTDDRYVLYRGNGIMFSLPTNNGGFAGGISYRNPEDNTIEGSFGLYRNNYYYFGQSYDNANGTVKAAKFVGALNGTADVAKKLGTATVGSNTKFFYLSGGTATASTATIGSGIKPMFLSSGVFTASSSTIGDTNTPVYLNAGTITSTGKSFADYLTRSGGSMTGAMSFSVGNSDVTGNPINQISGTMGSNDQWKITSGATAVDAGFLEISTHDNGNEPIYFAQYSSGTRTRRLTLLDASGNTILPGTLTASGATINGNASVTGRTTTSKLTLTTSAGSWISGMTLTNPSIQISTKNSSGSYHPIMGGKTYNDHVWNLGTYVDNIGFYGFKNGRTANGTDWSFIINSSTGAVSSSAGITAPTFTGTASAVSGISSHIRDNLTGNGVVDKALSANQGYQLKTSLDTKMPSSYFHWSGQTGQPTWLWGGNAYNDYYVWNPSNFSVANAATCANLAPSHSVGANTIVTRQANGYTFLNYINSNTSYNENPAIGNFIVVNSSDGAYYRKASIEHVKSALKVPTFSLSGTTLTITLA